ncbi:MAG: glycosyltransferase family 4 protein [Anaerolineales bacterium]|nr:glycosyltransferase family 4 protein [Anaerolineales bacterium]MDW8162775.1 glycosyltransferase family 1 protein [Anaerolineales bacterium]
MVRVLVDASDITNLSGSRTAVYELYDAVFRLKSDWNFVVLVSQVEEGFSKYPWVKQICIPYGNRLLQRVFIQLVILRYDLSRRIDVVHFSRSIGGITINAKNVLSVFDITPLIYPKYYPKSTYLYWKCLAPFLFPYTNKIVAISQTVKSDLIRYYPGIDNNKVDVVYCAPKSTLLSKPRAIEVKQVRLKYGLPDEYLLYLGILARKKNLPTLVDALFLLKKRCVRFPPLVVAGGIYRKSDDYRALMDTISRKNMERDILVVGPVHDNDLAALLHGAFIFLYPSLHEGFGIPCLEAMACGVPVITTNSGAIPEVVGDAAILVQNPLDSELFADAICALLNDPQLRRTLIERGLKRARNFSWTSSAKRLIEIFESIVQG